MRDRGGEARSNESHQRLARRPAPHFEIKIRDLEFGIRDPGFGIRDSDFGIFDPGFGIRNSVFEIRVYGLGFHTAPLPREKASTVKGFKAFT